MLRQSTEHLGYFKILCVFIQIKLDYLYKQSLLVYLSFIL